MTRVTKNLHASFLRALGPAVRWHSPLHKKPLCVDLSLPNPPRLRVYMYTLVDGVATVRQSEFKGVLRVPGQKVGEYGSFDHSDGRLALLVAYREDLDVFVLWDASLHPKFKNGGNVQVRGTTVHDAAARGRAEQLRPLSSGLTEVVIACQSSNLPKALDERLTWTGGVTEGEWARSQT